MVWWLMKQCFSAMIRSLRLTTPSVECAAVKFSTIVIYLLIFTNYHRFKHGVVVSERVFFSNLRFATNSGRCVTVKFCTIVSYLLIFTNHRRFKHGVVVSERVFFCNDKTFMAYCMLHPVDVWL